MISEQERKRIVKELISENRQISINEALSVRELEHELQFLRADSPILFHLGDIRYSVDRLTKRATIFPEYTIALDEYKQLTDSIISKVNQIRKEVSVFSSQYETEKYIHDYFCRNITYSEEGQKSHTIIGPLLEGKGVCEGISKAARLLLRTNGINSFVVIGKARAEDESVYSPHAWNTVCINQNWCHLDITFDLCISRGVIRYDYFNVPDHIISIDHISEYDPCDTGPLCQTDAFSYYSQNNLKISSVDMLKQTISANLKAKKPCFQFEAINMSESAITACAADYLNGSLKYLVNKNRGIYTIFLDIQ